MSSLNMQGEQSTSVQNTKKSELKKLFILPLYLLVPFLFVFLFHNLGLKFGWKGFALGVLGWTIALFLRGPVSAIALKTATEKKARLIVVSSSGPLEELVRLTILLLTGTTYSWAASVGQGWAAIEIVLAIINTVIIFYLTTRDDEEAKKAIDLLKMQGKFGISPVWGIVERIFASAYHIGATLIVAAIPWLVVVLIPFHSFFNLTVEKLLQKKSIVFVEGFIAISGVIVLMVGIILQIIL